MWATISGLQLFVVPAVTGGGPSAPGWGPSSSAAAGGLAVEGGLQLQAAKLMKTNNNIKAFTLTYPVTCEPT